jgi:hypothetical protein
MKLIKGTYWGTQSLNDYPKELCRNWLGSAVGENFWDRKRKFPHDVMREIDHRERHMIYRINRRWNDFIRRPINHSALSALTRKCVEIYLVVPYKPSWRDSSEEVSHVLTLSWPCFSCRLRREVMLCLLSTSSLHLLSRSTANSPFHAVFLLGLFFEPEDGGDKYLRIWIGFYRIILFYVSEDKTLHALNCENRRSNLVHCWVCEWITKQYIKTYGGMDV